MRVLLTGGSGYLGREIARALARRGHEAIIFARSAEAAVRDGVPGIACPGDVRDAAALDRAASGCDAICHTAAMVTLWRRDRTEFDAVNVGGLTNAIDVACKRRLHRVVYTSSFLALPPSDARSSGTGNDYQRTKRAAERAADEAIRRGAPIVRLYPGVIYGPGAATEGNLVPRLLADHVAGRRPGIIGGDHIWSFAFVGDVADAHVTALEKARINSAYQLGGENLPQRRIFELLREDTGRPLPRHLPAWLGRLAGRMEELRARTTNTTPRLTRGTVEIFEHDWAMDSSAAIRDLDYRITPFNDAFRRVLPEVLNLQP
ncbi:MAG: NAD-dependent epimerase/dehydratase family protein [Acidobacteriota bacterium]